MSGQIEAYLAIQKLGPAARVTALERVKPLVEADPDLATVALSLTDALDANRQAVEAERTFKGQLSAQQMHRDEAVELDRRLDKVVGALYQVLGSMFDALPADNALRATIGDLRDTLFPRGLAAVVNRRYVEQHQLVNAMLQHLRTRRGWNAAANAIGLGPLLDELAEVNEAYGKAVTDQSQGPTFADVKAADLAAFRRYCAVIVAILARYPSDSDGDTAQRETLLAPVHAQEREARAYRRRRAEAANGDAASDDASTDDVEPAPPEDEPAEASETADATL